jgi:hypothetical protein
MGIESKILNYLGGCLRREALACVFMMGASLPCSVQAGSVEQISS